VKNRANSCVITRSWVATAYVFRAYFDVAEVDYNDVSNISRPRESKLQGLLPKATRVPPAQCPGHRRAPEGRSLIARGGTKWNPGFQPQPRNRALKGRCKESGTRTTPAGFGDIGVDSSWGSASLHPRLLSTAPSALPEKPSPWGMTDSRFGQQTLQAMRIT